jgi:ZIP family zinc transporter
VYKRQVISYAFLHDISPNSIGTIEAFAAGAILAMLADSMMPEAFEEGGAIIALLTLFGFLTAFIVSRL